VLPRHPPAPAASRQCCNCFGQVHIWPNLKALVTGNLGRPAVAADPDPELRERMSREHGGVELLDSYDALLERSDLDAVFVYADNRTTIELALRAVERGLPNMIEKPMAADLAGAEALLAAARKAGVPLMVNWPTAWRPTIRHGLELARDGAVGEPIQLSNRGGHVGPREYGCSPQFCDWLYDRHRCGGGALIDYCGYGALLCRALLGRPESVTAVAAHLRKEGLEAEDNAIVVLRYPRALGLLEGTWTQVGGEPAYGMIVYGDRGTLLVHQPKAPGEGKTAASGRVQLITSDGRNETFDPPPLPSDGADGPTYFLSRLRADAPIEGLCSPEIGRDVQEILEAALRSNAEGRRVTLPRSRG
jgi:predicted dehydrogenase